MRLKGLFAIMAAALMLSMSFTSCEELEGLIDDEKESTDNQAFFPNSYRQRTVAAWYSLTEKEENGTRIEAVFLFDDNSFVTTKSRTYTDGRSQERKILAEGDYTLTGDYENGTAEVKINGAPEPMTVEIKDGKMLAMGETFTKQNNKKVPKPSEESEGGQGGEGQGGEGQGGQGGDNHIEAFFPTDFSAKTVSAWYSEAGEMQEQGFDMKYNASIYFFTDGIFVATVHTVIDGPQGPVTNKAISISGEYSILQGDFTNGTIKLKGSDGKEVTVELKEGKLTYVEVDGKYTIYVKQDNSKVPQPSEPDNNGQQGGYGSDVPAFFPSSYANKSLLVWYKCSEVKDNSTRVEAVFLFADGTFVTTKNKVYSKEDGRSPEREIIVEGTYSLISGDYQDGVLKGILANGETMDITIENGIMKAKDENFAMQDATELPEPSDPTNNGQQGGEGQGDEVLAFFPNQFANSTVIAWYSFKEGEPAETRVMAVFLLDGNLAVITQNKVFGESTSMNPERYILDYGKYQLTEGSDYENGSATVILERLGEKRVTINNGILRVDGLYGDYTKRDNADVPKPLDPTDQGQQGGEGDGDDDGDDDDGDGDSVEFDQSLLKAYLPSDFSSEAIVAWYMYYGEDNNTCRIESVFLFNDNTLIVTKTKIYSKADGRAPEYKVTDKGQYRLAEGGDYENGTASVVTASGMSFDVVIEDGIMSAMDLEFALVSNDLLSIMTTNGKN